MLQAGKHVLFESRVASTVADCRTIMDAVATSKGILQIGHICRFNPRYRAAEESARTGQVVKIG